MIERTSKLFYTEQLDLLNSCVFVTQNENRIHIRIYMDRTKTHLQHTDVSEHRATDRIQLTTDTTLLTVKTKPYSVMQQQSNESIYVYT